MGLGPIGASRQALARAGLTIDDIDLVEINEAFAAQVIPSAKHLGIPWEKLNVHGGGIALGHPFGMTGARIMTTLLNGLEDGGGRYGLETMCVGGGQGMAMIVERLSYPPTPFWRHVPAYAGSDAKTWWVRRTGRGGRACGSCPSGRGGAASTSSTRRGALVRDEVLAARTRSTSSAVSAPVGDDDRGDDLAVLVVGHTDHRDLGDVGVRGRAPPRPRPGTRSRRR